MGSARSGQPARSARTRAADAGVPPLRLRVGGRRAGRRRPPRFGVGQQRFLELEVELGRSASPGRDLRGRVEVRCGGVDAEVEAGGEDPEDAVLLGRLVGSGATHGRGAVGGEEHEAPAGVRGLHDGGQQVAHGRAGRRDHSDRRPRARRQAQGQEPGGPLVDPDVQPHVPGSVRGMQSDGQSGRARAGAEDHLAHATRDQGGEETLRALRGPHDGRVCPPPPSPPATRPSAQTTAGRR